MYGQMNQDFWRAVLYNDMYIYTSSSLSSSGMATTQPTKLQDKIKTLESAARAVQDTGARVLQAETTREQAEAENALLSAVHSKLLKNLDALEDYTNTPGHVSGHALHHGATITEIEQSRFQGIRRMTDNSIPAVKACFVRQAKEYLKSFTGGDRLPKRYIYTCWMTRHDASFSGARHDGQVVGYHGSKPDVLDTRCIPLPRQRSSWLSKGGYSVSEY